MINRKNASKNERISIAPLVRSFINSGNARFRGSQLGFAHDSGISQLDQMVFIDQKI